jgi:hypothetical protein
MEQLEFNENEFNIDFITICEMFDDKSFEEAYKIAINKNKEYKQISKD